MGPAVQYRFQRLPSASRYFPRAVFGRRNALVPQGGAVPRLEGSAELARAGRRHLVRYRELCGFADDGCLPLTYPHVLAMPLQFAILTHPAFPVRLMGLIHVANDIRQTRPLPATGSYRLRSWIEGHRDADRGHEFDLFTSVEDAQGTAWIEKSTLLARRPASGKPSARGARQALRYEKPADGAVLETAAIPVPRAIGRRYGWLSGDLNPIHLGDRGAKLFGFDRAVAHGMWSMARSLAALGTTILAPPVQAVVEFKFPLFLPGDTRLEHWPSEGRQVFVLKDAGTGRPHLAGSARTA
ncbi:MAG TPA: MaoC/PaaZ C-terminal domain-containing protein [Steroidobacteraceae bacterium]|nr:MaoC/PaaZ C-terminal domain-containing protein [Steroidobacteraceae bacterium]